jgi:hypothetical protein
MWDQSWTLSGVRCARQTCAAMKPREILNQLIVPSRTAEDCNLCEGESTCTHGVYYIRRVTHR